MDDWQSSDDKIGCYRDTYWYEGSKIPRAGVIYRYNQYYVWPPLLWSDLLQKFGEEEALERCTPCLPFPTLEAAKAACMLLYKSCTPT